MTIASFSVETRLAKLNKVGKKILIFLSYLTTECTAMLSPRSVPVSNLETVFVNADVRIELTMQREQHSGNKRMIKSQVWLI